MLNFAVISQHYQTLGYRLGWTLFACPEDRRLDADVAIVGLNPATGGCEVASEYREIWDVGTHNSFTGDDSRMQAQVRRWHDMLRVPYGSTLNAQFVPFRSGSWTKLEGRDAALALSRDVWGQILADSPATLFIAMGHRVVAAELAALTGADLIHPALPGGWGRQSIRAYSDGRRRIVSMPHPSRYALFGRGAASEIAVASFETAVGRPIDRSAGL